MPVFDADGVGVDDPRFTAAITFLRRQGAREFQIRYDEEQEPVVWVAVSSYSVINGRPASRGKINAYQTGSGMSPLSAVFNLVRNSVNFHGMCAHCGRNTMFDEWFGEQPLEDVYCWYQWDPELQVFRRGCEGDT